MEAAPEPAHTARSRRRSSCPAVWIDRQLTGRSAALRRHHAALPSEDTPRALRSCAKRDPSQPDAKVLTLDQGHVTICHNPSVHRTPCCPGVTQMVQGIKVCTVRCGVRRRRVSLCALLREQLELARSRQLRRDRRLAHSRRATKEDQLAGSATALLRHAGRHVRPRQRLEKNRGQ